MGQPYILQELRRRIGDYVMPSFLNVRLERAQLGNRAGMLGAAVAAEQMAGSEAGDTRSAAAKEPKEEATTGVQENTEA